MLIRELPAGERPMARLARLGPKYLSDQELLAILLGGETALSVAGLLLKTGLQRLQNHVTEAPISELRKARMHAFLELAVRLETARRAVPRVILGAEDIGPYLVAKYSHEPREIFGVVFLDSRRRLIAEREISIGQHNFVKVTPRAVIKAALAEDADAVIFFHNHPGGEPGPSAGDVEITALLWRACSAVDLTVVDHLVIGRREYASFEAKGLLHRSPERPQKERTAP